MASPISGTEIFDGRTAVSPAACPLIDITAGNIAAENDDVHHFVGRSAHDELAALEQKIISQSSFLNRHDHARRLGAGRRKPHGGEKIQAIVFPPGDDESRDTDREGFVAVVAGLEVNGVLPIHGLLFYLNFG